MQFTLNADHSNVVRFEKRSDDNYKNVLFELNTIIQSITKPSFRRKRTGSNRTYIFPPLPTKFFTGRKDDLQRLCDIFLGDDEEVIHKLVALYGQSGSGKTQLALKYAEDNFSAYDYVILLNATSKDTFRTELTNLHVWLGLPGSSQDAVFEVTDWLLNPENGKWLAIFDNANNASDIMPVINSVLHGGHIIVTSQDSRLIE
jgi:hypothetical protein